VAVGFESTTSRLADGHSLGFVKVKLGTSPPRSPMSSLREVEDYVENAYRHPQKVAVFLGSRI